MRVTLTVTAGPHKGHAFVFDEHATFVVGRAPGCQFQLPAGDRYFSRTHFLVEVNPPHCRILDLGSRNGTQVNDVHIESADLKDGDKIRAGRTILHVAVHSEPGDMLAPTHADSAPVPPEPAELVESQTMPAHPASPSLLAEPRCCPSCGAPYLPKAAIISPESLCPACEKLACGQQLRVPGCRIIREIGKGGMGIVYLAIRISDATPLAVKTITPSVAGSPLQVERFLREANILRELDHPHIVRFREMGEAGNRLYFAMDYVRGTDAAALLERDGPLSIPRAVGLVCQMLRALEYAHGKGFVHRDIKPNNLLVIESDGREFVKLADFGLARVYHSSQLSGLTMCGQIGGTLAFMPPEQIMNFREARPLTDQYAAAATLYRLLTGAYIFDLPQDFNKQLAMILNDRPVPIRTRRRDVPMRLAQVIHKALSRQTVDRFSDVRAMREALSPFHEQPLL